MSFSRKCMEFRKTSYYPLSIKFRGAEISYRDAVGALAKEYTSQLAEEIAEKGGFKVKKEDTTKTILRKSKDPTAEYLILSLDPDRTPYLVSVTSSAAGSFNVFALDVESTASNILRQTADE